MNSKDIILIAKGKKRYLHPKLDIFENIECNVWYDREFKFFYIEYDIINNKPNKSLLTKDTEFVLIEIGKYVKRKMEEESERLDRSFQESGDDNARIFH